MNPYSAKTVKAVFFMSGFAALIYQIAWQRMLFTAFGVDLESITIIIAVFMAGLGNVPPGAVRGAKHKKPFVY